MERTDPDLAGDEATLLTQFLDYHRATLVRKAAGLDRAGASVRVGRSDLTLAGLVKHCTHVEDSWFGYVLLGHPRAEPWASAPFAEDPDWEFHSAADDDPADLIAAYVETCERSRAHTAAALAAGGLDTPAARPGRDGRHVTLRWILLHMIEETARHNGHADLLREAADGATGE